MVIRKSKLVLAALALLPTLVFAADPAADAIKRCAQLKDSLERLVCFDKVAAGLGTATPAAAAPATAAPATAVPSLGAEALKKPSDLKKEKQNAPTSLAANITRMQPTAQNVSRIWLDNGQAWQQEESSVRFEVRVGDAIQIRKGSLGGYQMSRADNSGGWVRVSRVK
jgi:hypothetical protein